MLLFLDLLLGVTPFLVACIQLQQGTQSVPLYHIRGPHIAFLSLVQVSEWFEHESKVVHLLSLGSFILSVDTGGWLFVWDATNLAGNPSPLRKIHLEEGVSPTCIMHPDTYLNKVFY